MRAGVGHFVAVAVAVAVAVTVTAGVGSLDVVVIHTANDDATRISQLVADYGRRVHGL